MVMGSCSPDFCAVDVAASLLPHPVSSETEQATASSALAILFFFISSSPIIESGAQRIAPESIRVQHFFSGKILII